MDNKVRLEFLINKSVVLERPEGVMGKFSFSVLCVAVCYLSTGYNAQNPGNEINKFFDSLNYNVDEVLTYKGESISSFLKKEGSVNDQKKFIVITRERKSISNGKSDVGVLSSSQHLTYPGSLLLANHRLLDNMPDQLVADRAPLQYTINLPGLVDGDGGFKTLPSFSDYQKSLNHVLKTWFENYSKDQTVPAMYQSVSTFAYSKEQLRVAFGLDFKSTSVESNIDFSAVNNQERTVMVHQFKQIFYTVSTQAPRRPSDLFAADVTVESLARRVSNENPPLMVDSVSYGRVIYVVMETSSTGREAKAFMETNFSKYDLNNTSEVDYSQTLKDFSMKVFVMGGSTSHVDLINARTLKEVADSFVQYKHFTRDNPGYPLTYSTIFVKDNSRGVIQSTTEYTETSRTEYSSGIIALEHYGGYVAQFKVSWNLISYNENGDEISSRDYWDKNLQDLTAPFTTEIQLPGNARDIEVFAQECTGLIWEWWRTVINRSGIPLINHRSFKISGTTLNPTSDINPPL